MRVIMETVKGDMIVLHEPDISCGSEGVKDVNFK